MKYSCLKATDGVQAVCKNIDRKMLARVCQISTLCCLLFLKTGIQKYSKYIKYINSEIMAEITKHIKIKKL